MIVIHSFSNFECTHKLEKLEKIISTFLSRQLADLILRKTLYSSAQTKLDSISQASMNEQIALPRNLRLDRHNVRSLNEGRDKELVQSCLVNKKEIEAIQEHQQSVDHSP